GILGNGGGRRKHVFHGFKGTTSIEVITPAPRPKAEPEMAAPAPAAETEEPEEEVAAIAPAATASAQVKISNMQYSGDEYIEISNEGDEPVSLAGWTIRDQNDTDQAYTFPEDTELPAGDTLQVYTKPGHDYSFKS